MATTHTARRRQRPMRRTPASTAHARAHRGPGARQDIDALRRNRAAAPTGVTPSPAPASSQVLAVAEEFAEPVRAPAAKPIRTPDADDHLAAYFRQLAEHELLTPEDERELSQGIEDTEILTWERVFARPDLVVPVLALVEPNLET